MPKLCFCQSYVNQAPVRVLTGMYGLDAYFILNRNTDHWLFYWFTITND